MAKFSSSVLSELLSPVLTYTHDGKLVTMADVSEGKVRYVPNPQTGDIELRRWKKTRNSNRPRCGAKCRDGHACNTRCVKRMDGSIAGRCRLHGGLSTGARTAEGRARISESNRRRVGEIRKRRPAGRSGQSTAHIMLIYM